MLVPGLLPDGATVTETEACAHLRPMIEKLAARFARFAPRYSLYEDLVQEGNLGAILAFRSWRADGGASLQNWASHQVKEHMRLCLERVAFPTHVPKQLRGKASERPRAIEIDAIPEPSREPTQEKEAIDRADADKALSLLSGRNRRIVFDHVVHDRTMRDLAAEEGITASRVNQIVDESLVFLRRKLA